MCVCVFVAWVDAFSSCTLVWGVSVVRMRVCVCGAAVVRGHFAPPCPGQPVGNRSLVVVAVPGNLFPCVQSRTTRAKALTIFPNSGVYSFWTFTDRQASLLSNKITSKYKTECTLGRGADRFGVVTPVRLAVIWRVLW